jgi:cation diffusion facilitator CzcD-associated flavoprotein CzcO
MGEESGEEFDVLVVGAGITGIQQLYRAREAGFTVRLLEAGEGVGGTWFWNRYPGARFDSESYTYGYLFSEELFRDWQWQEHFAAQPEIERYLNHVVDRFDLRSSIELGARVTGARFDEEQASWQVSAAGRHLRARFLIAATGVLSIPFYPDVPGRDSFGGVAVHTGAWPTTPVDFAGKRVAVVGTGSSGVQIVPAIASEVESLHVFQRSANWCTPLNNAAITAEEQRKLRQDFEGLREVLSTSLHGFHHVAHDRKTFEDPPGTRALFFEKMWNSPGFTNLTSNYTDLLFDQEANAQWCAFVADKIRSIVRDSEVAESLIPTDHRWGEKRPPFVTGYYEAFNRPNVSLVDLRRTPMVRVTESGIETSEIHREFDIVIWATGFDFGTGALARMGIEGRRGQALVDAWADGPRTFLGVQSVGFPNLFFPGGPHAAAGNNPRYNGDQVDFIMDTLVYMRDRGYDWIEPEPESEERWTRMVDRGAAYSSFGESSYYFGSNVPGKPRKYLLNSGGRPKLFSTIAEVRQSQWAPFRLGQAPALPR